VPAQLAAYLDRPGPARPLAADMRGAWVRFVTDGDPGWARYETSRRPVMVFDEPSAVYEDLHAMERVAWA
jgi:para-nitrobenzyl esterase